jgi:hypothetical protein
VEPIQDRVFLNKRVPRARDAEAPDWVPPPPPSAWALVSAPVSGAPVSGGPGGAEPVSAVPAGSVSAVPSPSSAVPMRSSAPPMPGGPGWVRPSGSASGAAAAQVSGVASAPTSGAGFAPVDGAPVQDGAGGKAGAGAAGAGSNGGARRRPRSGASGAPDAPAPTLGPKPPQPATGQPGYPARPVSAGLPAYPGQPVSAGVPVYPGRPVTAPPFAPRATFPPGALQRHWPAPAEPTPAALAGVGLTGLSAALFLRFGAGPSVGWLIVGLVAAGCVMVTRRAAVRAIDGGAWTPSPRALWGVAAVALLSVGTVRAAGWLFLLCAPLALVCASVAMAGGRTGRTLLVTAFSTPFAGFRAIPWFSRGASRQFGRSTGSQALRLTAALAVTLALVLVFGSLFAAADPAFKALVDRLVPDIRPAGLFGAGWRFMIFAWGGLGAVYLASRPPAFDAVTPGERKPVRRVEWLLPVVVLDGLFLTFVAVQFGAWFGRDDYVRRTAGLTYADYARKGFWQLVTVSVLTLAVLAVAARKAPRENRGDRVALRVVLGALTVLSLVVVYSALLRMSVYEQAYGLTRLRLLVAVCEVAIGLVFVMVLAAGIRLNGAWIPRAVLGTAVVALLSLATLNPDRLIADRNIDRHQAHPERRLDVSYLGSLSADAAPAFDRLPEAERNCALRGLQWDLRHDGDAWYEFNVGRAVARELRPSGFTENCWRL